MDLLVLVRRFAGDPGLIDEVGADRVEDPGPGDAAQRAAVDRVGRDGRKVFWNQGVQGLHLDTVGLGADYDVMDALVVGGGVLIYIANDRLPASGWALNDRLFFNVKYSF